MLAGVVLLAIAVLSPLIAERLLRRRLGDARGARRRVRRLRPGAPRPRHLLGLGALPRLRRRHGHPTASCASCSASSCAVVGVTAAGPYGFAVALAPLFGVASSPHAVSLQTPTRARRRRGTRSRRTSAGCCSARCSPPRCSTPARSPPRPCSPTTDEAELVTQFAYGVLLARIPLFMFQAVQAALLPRLSRLAARGELDEFRAGLRRLLMLVVAVGVVGTARRARARAVRDRARATTPSCSGRTLAMLALGSACYMVALALAQAVIALKGHALVALGWVIGVVAFVLGTWLAERRPVPPGRDRARRCRSRR